MNGVKVAITDGIEEYVARDWALARQAKDAYWAARIRSRGPAEGIRIADELRRQMRLIDPHWPSPAERDRDLASHARVSELWRRADHTRGD
jgi:hypothetical protein